MAETIDQDYVSAVLLPDGKWYTVSSFKVFESLQIGKEKVRADGQPVIWPHFYSSIPWALLVTSEGDHVYCPVTSIVSFQYDEPDRG